MNRDELQNLPTILDVPTAARVLDIGRSLAYELIRRGEWPTKPLRVGRLIKIPTAPLLTYLGETPTGPASPATSRGPAPGSTDDSPIGPRLLAD